MSDSLPIKSQNVKPHQAPTKETGSGLTESEQKTKESVEPIFEKLSQPLSSRTDLIVSRSPTEKRSKGLAQKELNIQEEIEVFSQKIESSIEMEKNLEKISGNRSEHLIKEFNSNSQLEQSVKKDVERIKKSSSENEKILAYGSLVGSLIESVPLQLDAIENGAKDVCREIFIEATKLLGHVKATEPFSKAGTILVAKVIGIQIEDRINKYKDQLNQLEPNDPRAEQIEEKIRELENSKTLLLPGLNINDSVNFVKGNIENAIKQLTPLFPKGEKTFANRSKRIFHFCRFSGDSIRSR